MPQIFANHNGFSLLNNNFDNVICENDGSLTDERKIKKNSRLAFYENGKAVGALKAKWRECVYSQEEKKEIEKE